MGRVFAYFRFANNAKYKNPGGLIDQAAECLAYAKREGVVISRLFHDDRTAGDFPLDDRLGFVELMAAIEPGDVVVVARLDRFGRDLRTVRGALRWIESKGGSVVSVASAGSELMAWVVSTLDLMDQFLQRFQDLEHILKRARTEEGALPRIFPPSQACPLPES
jgi:DNA invertase Pin-like site-specific DNA recombinase